MVSRPKITITLANKTNTGDVEPKHRGLDIPASPRPSKSDLDPTTQDVELNNPKLFTHLRAQKGNRLKMGTLSLSTSPETPIYNILIHNFKPSNPSIVLVRSASPNTVLGVVKLHGKSTEIGIGDPNYILDESDASRAEKEMIWEKLVLLNRWNFRDYEFEWGQAGDRKVFGWYRTKSWLGTMMAMELREKGKMEVLGVWRRKSKMTIKIGDLFLRKRAEDGDEFGKWAIMATLSCLSIVEAEYRRR